MKPLLLLCLGWSIAVRAQGTGGTYSAPGMPLHLQRGTQTVPTRRQPIVTVSRSITSPSSSILTRFWHEADTAGLIAAQPFYRFTSSKLKYPANSLRAQVEGKFSARLTIGSDGAVNKVEITRRVMIGEMDPLYAAKGLAELDSEITRVMKLARFEPGVAADTVTVTSVFRIQ
jgi:outer membrane biosynthesis protein TonB